MADLRARHGDNRPARRLLRRPEAPSRAFGSVSSEVLRLRSPSVRRSCCGVGASGVKRIGMTAHSRVQRGSEFHCSESPTSQTFRCGRTAMTAQVAASTSKAASVSGASRSTSSVASTVTARRHPPTPGPGGVGHSAALMGVVRARLGVLEPEGRRAGPRFGRSVPTSAAPGQAGISSFVVASAWQRLATCSSEVPGYRLSTHRAPPRADVRGKDGSSEHSAPLGAASS